jgi:predicted transcriptional regulator
MPRLRPEVLSRREREIVDALFALGNRASVEDVLQRLASPPSYSAVRAALATLERKGHVRHVVEGARYIYSATTSPATATRSALDRYVRVFFQGSRSRMVTALLRQGSWTDEELEQLHAEIAEARARANSRADGLQGRKPRESS